VVGARQSYLPLYEGEGYARGAALDLAAYTDVATRSAPYSPSFAGRAVPRPLLEGKFDRDGFTYNLTVTKPNEITEHQVRQVLSMMVLVPGSGGASTPPEPSWMSAEGDNGHVLNRNLVPCLTCFCLGKERAGTRGRTESG
jgi:hypothetical protein